MSLTRLKNHVKIIRGKTCSIEKLGKPYLSLSFLRTKEGLDYTNDNGVWVEQGDILVVVSGGNAGEVLLSKYSGFIPATIAKISFNKNKVDESFLYQELKNHESKFRHFAKAKNFHFTLDVMDFLNTKFNLPSLDEQIVIGNKFKSKMESYEKISKEIEFIYSLIEEYKISFIDKLFKKSSFDLFRIKDIANTKVSLLPKDSKFGYKQQYLSAQSIKDGKISEIKTMVLDESSKPVLLKENTIVLSLVGGNAGKVAIVNKNKYIASQSLSCIKSEHYLSIYLYLNYVKKDWQIYSKGAALPSINNSVVKNQIIPIIKDEKVLKNAINTMNCIEKIEELLYNYKNFKEMA